MQSDSNQPSPPPAPARKRNFISRSAVRILAIIGVVWLIQLTVLPWFVGWRVGRVLASLGLPDARFIVRNVSHHRAIVAQITGSDGGDPTVDVAAIQYSFPAILIGRLDAVDLTGARLTLDAGRGTMLIGVRSLQGGGASPGAMPVGKLSLRSSSLVIRAGGAEFWVATSGTLEKKDGKLNLSLIGNAGGAAVTLNGQVDPTAATADLRLVVSRFDLASIPALAGVMGQVDLDIHMHGPVAAPIVDASLKSDEVLFPRARAVFRNLSGQCHFEPGDNPTGSAKLDVASAEVSDWDFTSADPGGPGLELTADQPPVRGRPFGVNVVFQHSTIARREGVTRMEDVHGVLPLNLNIDGSNLMIQSGSDAMNIAAPNIRLGDATVHLPKLGLTGSLSAGGGKSIAVDAKFHFADASAELGQVWAKGAEGIVPVSLNAPQTTGSINITSLGLGQSNLPGTTGSLEIADGRLVAHADWPVLTEATAVFDGQFDLTHVPVHGQMSVKLPEFKLTDATEMARLLGNPGGADVLGDFSADGTIELRSGRLWPTVALHGHDVTVVSRQYDLQFEGVSGVVNIDGLDPLTTPGGQSLYIEKANVGRLNLDAGNAQFRIEGLHSLLLESSNWDWEGGKLYTSAFRVDRSPQSLELTVGGDGLNLQSIFSTFVPTEASGVGRMFGRMPVKIRWPRIYFGTGYLYSAPGPGTVSLGSQMLSSLGDLLDRNDPRFATVDLYKQAKAKTLEAMSHFQYDLLTMDWQTGAQGMLASIHVRGKGGGNDGQPIDLTINCADLDRALTRYLIMRRPQNTPQSTGKQQ